MRSVAKFWIPFSSVLLIALFSTQALYAYHIWQGRTAGGAAARVHFDPLVFSVDNQSIVLPEGGNASDGVDNGAPNNDSLGLLYRIDGHSGTQDCDAVGQYQNSGATPYNETYNSMASWSTEVPNSVLNLQYVCSTDFTIASVDGVDDGPSVDVYDSSTGQFVLNGFNEIVMDDTANLDIIGAIFSGADPAVILGVGIAITATGIPLPDLSTDGTDEIAEAVLFINQSPNLPSGTDLPSTIIHEIGHTLGLGHSGTVLNARGVGFDVGTTLNNGSTPTSISRVPLMYAYSLGGETPSLKPDDIAAVTLNYPIGSPANVGAISGKILNTLGSPVPGSSVIAYDSNGDEVGVYAEGNPFLSGGDYIIDNVPPGTYRVILIPMRGDAASGRVSPGLQSDGIFPAVSANFGDAYFDLVTSEGVATIVTVSAGMETTGVDFLVLEGSGSSGAGGQGFGGFVELENSGGCSMMGSAGSVNLLSQWMNLLLLLSPVGLVRWLRRTQKN